MIVVSFCLVFVVVAVIGFSSLSCQFWPFISSPLQIAPKKFQEIFENSRIKLFVSRRQQRTLFADLK